jgi:tetrapyrrole methylase family protein / MazG family protein
MEIKEKRPLYSLAEIARILREPDGCAWDIEQDHQSLKPYLIEETYEAYDAITSRDDNHMKEELGDLLYQVYAHAQIASERNAFTIDDVAEGIAKKLIHRHPHVFGDDKVSSAAEVSDRWEKIKKKEKSHRESILDGVPAHLPALLKAYRIQEKVARIGFDWPDIEDAGKKLDEEIHEFKEALASGDRDHAAEEAGDILFSMVNLFRFLKINPEESLRTTIDKFITRFKYIEKAADKDGKNLDQMSLEEMDFLWEEAKKISRNN